MDPTPYRERRRRLAEQMRRAGGGLAIVPTAPERPRNADSDHPYRHDSHFHYLTGFDEPGAWLLLGSDGRTALLLREKNPERELWEGARLGSAAAPAALGVDQAYPLESLDEVVRERLAGQSAAWIPFGTPGLQARLEGWVEALHAQARSGVRPPASVRDLQPLLAEMRLVKEPGELAIMRRAAAISAGAHMRAMRYCAARLRADPHGDILCDQSSEHRQVEERDESDLHFAGIRCPLCKWRPARSSWWVCWSVGPPENLDGGCGTRWNTFETRGICPGCSHQWIWTTCLGCIRTSPHEEWYENSPLPS